jgi:hypothetical protein
MTAHVTTPDPDVVASAAIAAVMDARWESSEALSRGPAELASDLLRRRAGELATSPAGRDQLLSVALQAAAADIAAGRPALADGALFLLEAPAPDPAARDALRAAVLKQGGVAVAESQRVAEEVEARQRRDGVEAAALAQQLRAEARLQELLWDDPRLPAAARTRLVMLCTIPRLLRRSEELDPSRRRKRLLEAKREIPRAAERPGGVRPPRADGTHPWSNAAGWLVLVGLFAAVVAGVVDAR